MYQNVAALDDDLLRGVMQAGTAVKQRIAEPYSNSPHAVHAAKHRRRSTASIRVLVLRLRNLTPEIKVRRLLTKTAMPDY